MTANDHDLLDDAMAEHLRVREELRAATERLALAGHVTDEPHDCFLMLCAHLPVDVARWRTAAGEAETERDKLRMVIVNAIDNIAHGRYGHAIKALRAARSLFS